MFDLTQAREEPVCSDGASRGWGSSSCPGFELSAARCAFSSQGFLGDSHMCSEVTMFLSPLKMLSLHFSVPGAEPEFRTEAGQSPGNQVLQ